MVEGDDYVSGGSVQWGRVAGAMVGAVLTVLGYAAARSVLLVGDAASTFLAGVAWFQASLVSLPFVGGSRIIGEAWAAFASSLGMFGPFAFPVAVATTVAVLLILYWGVSRVVWGY